MSESKAQEIFKAVQVVIAGYPATDAITALLGTLSLLIGMAATDQEGAMKVVDSLPGHLRVTVLENWDHARRLRDQSVMHATPGTTRMQ